MIKAETQTTLTRVEDGSNGKSAYQAALEGGLQSSTTEEQFNTDLGDVPETKQLAEETREDVDALDTRVTTAEGALTTVESNITTLSSRVNTAESNITSAETAIGNPSDAASASGSLYARINDANDDITAIDTLAQQAQSSASTASTAANNAGRAASLAQAALDTMGDYEWAMVAVSSPTGNPKEKKYWERTGTSPNYEYHYTTDTSVVSDKTYYQLNQEGQYFYKDINGAHIVDGSANGFRTDIQSNGLEITDTSTNNVVAAFTSSGYNIGNVDGPHQVGAPMSWKMIDWDGNTYAEIKDTRQSADDDLIITLDVFGLIDTGLPIYPGGSASWAAGAELPIPSDFIEEEDFLISDSITGNIPFWDGTGTRPEFPFYMFSSDKKIAYVYTNVKLHGVYENSNNIYPIKNDVEFTIEYTAPNKYSHGYKFGATDEDVGLSAISGGTSSATGMGAVGLGLENKAIGAGSTTLGIGNVSYGNFSLTNGFGNIAGNENTASMGSGSHAEGYKTQAIGNESHSEGYMTQAIGNRSHAEGYETKAIGKFSHAEGYISESRGNCSHAEGDGCITTDEYTHAEGWGTYATGFASHAEGELAIAQGWTSHAEGDNSLAIGTESHAEGELCLAIGDVSHAQGDCATAKGICSHAQGAYTFADGNYQTALGIGNVIHPNTDNIAFVIGNGSMEWGHYPDTPTTMWEEWNPNEEQTITESVFNSGTYETALIVISENNKSDNLDIELTKNTPFSLSPSNRDFTVNYDGNITITFAATGNSGEMVEKFISIIEFPSSADPNRSDAFAVNWDGDGKFNGDVYVNCNNDSTGGNKVATLQDVYPVGSIYINASNSTNPATLFGFGTWVAFGEGRVPVGVGTGTDSRSVSKSFTGGDAGGEYEHTITAAEMAPHTHSYTGPDTSSWKVGTSTSHTWCSTAGSKTSGKTPNQTEATAHNNIQPYITVYMWQRTA